MSETDLYLEHIKKPQNSTMSQQPRKFLKWAIKKKKTSQFLKTDLKRYFTKEDIDG